MDTLVLGCTHYPLLKPTIKKVVPRVTLIDSAEETAKDVRGRLEKEGRLARGRPARSEFYSSDDPEKFGRLGRLFLGRPLPAVRRLHLTGVD